MSLLRRFDGEGEGFLIDGADLVTLLHTEYIAQAEQVRASMEETTTGVIRLKALEREGNLAIPVIAVNDADTKHMFDNRYGTGQSTLDGIIRATDILVAGKVFVVVSLFLWFRATFPRYRYDQIMRLGWKVFIPLTIVWLVLIAAWMQTPWNIWR